MDKENEELLVVFLWGGFCFWFLQTGAGQVSNENWSGAVGVIWFVAMLYYTIKNKI